MGTYVYRVYTFICLCVCVCARVRERIRERGREKDDEENSLREKSLSEPNKIRDFIFVLMERKEN